MRKVLLLVVMLLFAMSNTACAAGKKGSAVEGKVVDAQGKPLANVKVIATQQQPLKGYERIETKTKTDGTFVLKGLYPSEGFTPMGGYNISVEGGQCNNEAVPIQSAPTGETTIIKGNVVLKFSPFKRGNDGFFTDSRTGLEWVPAPRKHFRWEQAMQYLNELSVGGGGWRMPTKEELIELYNTGKTGCGCGELFGGMGLDMPFYAWSSHLNGGNAWSFNLRNGEAYQLPRHMDSEAVVAVRSPK